MNSSNKTSKNSVLALVVIIIIVGIWYLEEQKPPSTVSSGSGVSLVQTNGVASSSYPQAEELVGITGYINSPTILTDASGGMVASSTAPFKLADFVGKKVILLDFWTYSCINCLRTLPYLEAWYAKYKDAGLVIVGVHTPEFDFEKYYGNVTTAVKQLGVTYPVALDSNMATWQAYGNMYWPHEYLINIDGFIVHDHIGEGDYDVTEQAIRNALIERDNSLGIPIPSVLSSTTGMANPSNQVAINPSEIQSPETYFGSARNEYLGNGAQGVAGSQTLSIPSDSTLNPETPLYLGGTWDFHDQFAENTSKTAEIKYLYDAKNVYFVASSTNGVIIKISKDGKPLGADAGKDVSSDSTVFVKENRLYDLIDGTDYGPHIIDIQVETPGLDAFTFTFG